MDSDNRIDSFCLTRLRFEDALEGASFDEIVSPELSERDIMEMHHEALLAALASFRDDLTARLDRLRYYEEPLGEADLTEWISEAERIIRDFP